MELIKEDGRIYAMDGNGKIIAEITFDLEGDKYNINHTFVDESLRGQGIASILVEEAVKYIKAKGYSYYASCPYAKKWLENHQEG